MVYFQLNGAPRSVEVREGETLLEKLRDRCGIRSTKDGCSPQGQCGCCTVLLDGVAVTSCAMAATRVRGKSVITLEGVAPAERTLFARAFVVCGAVQCGFCIPGFVTRGKAILDKNPAATRADIARGSSLHLCRCTGYKKILDAIDLVGRVRRGDAALAEPPRTGAVGTRMPKHLGERYVLGEEPYVADLDVAEMLHGALRLSDHPRARIQRIDVSRALAVPGVVHVATAADVPGERRSGLIEKDWPAFVAEGETTAMVGDVLAAVAAIDRHTARAAAALIDVEYEVLAPIVDAHAALADGAERVHADRENLLSRTAFARGDVTRALSASAHVVRETFRTQTIEHLYMEPEACLAVPSNDGTLDVYSQGQGVYDDRRQLCRVLARPQDHIRVHLVSNGGAFGGKEDLSCQAQTTLLAMLTGKPVKLVLSRDESIWIHPKRHPIEMNYDVGCDADGRLTAVRVRMIGDSGAYASVGAKVLERAAGHCCGPYRVPAVDVEALAVYTNNPPNGAMRGFGVNQSAFAIEQLLDMLGARVGKDPYQMREINLLNDGDRFATGQVMRNSGGLRRTLAAVRDVYYGAKVAGIACGIKNVGIGNGMADVGRARIDVSEGGQVVIHHGMTEMGQGLHTVAVQVFCDTVGVNWRPDLRVDVCTNTGLDCGMTTASRATVLVGAAVQRAAEKLRTDLARESGELARLAGRSYLGEFVCDWTVKPGTPIEDPVTHLAFGFATQVVILDEKTGKVARVVAAHDVGRAINPMLCEGQIEGSVHMGLGYALSEELRLEGGVPTKATMRGLGVLRAHQTPPVEVILVEEPESRTPFGARGIGEIGLVPTAPAVAAALFKFDGKRRTVLPMRDNYEGLPR